MATSKPSLRYHLAVVLFALIGSLFLAGCTADYSEISSIDPVVTALENYLNDNHQTPEEYIVGKFADHDLVFLGERHRLKHDVALVRNLIPRLHAAGVYHLGIEFADWADQALIDSLLALPQYDEQLARQIQFNQWPWWGYQDYIDIYKAAWEVNRTRPEGTPPFRVIGLNARSDWSHVMTPDDRRDPEVMKKVWPDGDSDKHMAMIIKRELLANGHAALIYAGHNHAFTRYHQPVFNAEKGELIRLNYERMGNLIYDEIGERCFNVSLHTPWYAETGYGDYVLAADSYIDSLIARLPDSLQRAGFDVIGTPFAKLTGKHSMWQHGYPDFTLDDFCDGYIIQGPLKEYKGVDVAANFLTDQNRVPAILQSANPNPRVKDTTRTAEDLMNSLHRDTEIQRIFANDIPDYDKLPD